MTRDPWTRYRVEIRRGVFRKRWELYAAYRYQDLAEDVVDILRDIAQIRHVRVVDAYDG